VVEIGEDGGDGLERDDGVALHLTPAATLALRDACHVGGSLEEIGTVITLVEKYTADGARIRSEPKGTAAGEETPHMCFQRGVLREFLYEACKASLGEASIITGTIVDGFEQDSSTATVTLLTDSAAGPRKVEGDIVIACDGHRSGIRKQAYPTEPAIDTEWFIWHGCAGRDEWLIGGLGGTPIDSSLFAGKIKVFGNRNSYFSYQFGYPNVIMWTASSRVGPLGKDPGLDNNEGWGRIANQQVIAPYFSAYTEPAVSWLLRESRYVTGVRGFDRKPIPDWLLPGGGVALCGDAGQALLPFTEQGGSLAVEAAAALARHLQGLQIKTEASKTASSIKEALTAWSQERKHLADGCAGICKEKGGVLEFLAVADLELEKASLHDKPIGEKEEALEAISWEAASQANLAKLTLYPMAARTVPGY
jgi:5-methylphenazine-1-carboxylate 1-monooxygenase